MKKKTVIGIAIVVVLAAGATGFFLYHPARKFAVSPLPQVVKQNPFQALIGLYPADSQFVGCLQAKLGGAFNAAYSEGKVSASVQTAMQGCVNTSTPALAISTGAPPAVRQCLEDALGSDFGKAIGDASFNPTPEENAKLNGCPAVKEFTDAKQKFAQYVKTEEDAAVNANADLPKTGTFAASSTAHDVSISAEVLESQGIIDSNAAELDVFGPARIRVTISADRSGCSFSEGKGYVPINGTSTDTVSFVPDSILSITDTSCKLDNGVVDMRDPSYTIASYKRGDYGKNWSGGGMFGFSLGNGGGASDTVVMTPVYLSQ